MQTLAAGLDQGRKRLAISLTPLIDIVFILVIFFMLASTFQQQGAIELTPPGPTGAATDRAPSQPVMLKAQGEGAFMLEGKPVMGQELVAALHVLSARDPEPSLRISAGENALLQDLVLAFDGAARAGLADVALAPDRVWGNHAQ